MKVNGKRSNSPQFDTVSPGYQLSAQINVGLWAGKVSEWIGVHDPAVVRHQITRLARIHHVLAQRLICICEISETTQDGTLLSNVINIY